MKPTNISVLILVLCVVMAAQVFSYFNPGGMSPDSFSILAQARAGVFTDAHPPLMSIIWGQIDNIVPGSVGVLIFNLTLFYGGIFLIFRGVATKHRFRAFFTLLIVGMFPPIIGILGAIWIDITMAGFFLVAVGLFQLKESVTSNWKGLSVVVISLLFLAFGVAIRHNGIAAACPLVAYFIFQSVSNRINWLLRLIISSSAGLVIGLLFFISANQFAKVLVDSSSHLWRIAALYDITGISFNEDSYLFCPGILYRNDLDDVRNLYSPRSYTPLIVGQQIHALPGHAQLKGKALTFDVNNNNLNKQLLACWKMAIIQHPASYFKHRYNVFKSLVTRSPWGLWGPVFDVVQTNDMGFPERIPSDSIYFQAVKRLTVTGFIFVPFFYLLISGVALIPVLVYGVARRNHALILAAALYGSGIAHMILLFFFAASADFRYSHWMIVTTVIATALVALELFHSASGKETLNSSRLR